MSPVPLREPDGQTEIPEFNIKLAKGKFFILLASFFAAQIAFERPIHRLYFLTGLSAGCAIATLHNGFFALVPLIVAHALVRNRIHPLGWLNRHLMVALLPVGLLTVAGYPQIILQPNAFLKLGPAGEVYLSSVHDVSLKLFTGKGIIVILRTLLSYEPILTVLAVLAVPWTKFHRQSRAKFAFLWSLPITYFIVFGLYDKTLPRFLCPVIPFLAIAAAWLVDVNLGKLISKILGSREGFAIYCLRRIISLLLVSLLILPGIVASIQLNIILTTGDTRDLARAWIEHNIPTGAVIAITEDIGLIPTKQAIQKWLCEVPTTVGTKDQWRLRLPEEQYPEPNYNLIRLWVSPGIEADDPASLIKAQRIQYLVVTQRAAPIRYLKLIQYASQFGKLIFYASPCGMRACPEYGNLPSELENPLIALWALQRSGPMVRIFEVDAAKNLP